MDVFDTIKAISASDHNEFLDAAIKGGAGVIGYFCSYVPEEIIHASGMVPYRMRAVNSGGTRKGSVYYSALNCSFVRACFGKVLEGDFSFLNGIVFMNGCDHIRRMYDNWKYADVPPDFRHMFVAPHVTGDTAHARFTAEIRTFARAIEGHFGVFITDESLRESIRLYNKKRRLLVELYSFRKGKIVPIKGSEVLSLMLAVTMMPVTDAMALIEEVIAALPGRAASRDGDIRIYLASGCMEEREHLELIESCGGAIVADSMCLGARHFDLEVEEKGDPWESLARRYLEHLSCPRMMNEFRSRLDRLHRTRDEYAIDAVIGEKLKFCDLWGGDLYLMKQESRKKRFPILLLERELYGGGDGQIRTRVQAFFEQVRNNIYSDTGIFRAIGADRQAGSN
ncbi:MAG TPA: 2-hydroxyacyl-CoA dehydratase family protein [Spirochaetota bacterium]|nr:2-hydroxyacyl-CoA dehydratase family protein [Spirochaetota bacterium]HPI89359.1 2-hydroxyacyl-CoA dehydratase family protein [Spirochaetota bacterium]HPR48296.1 2-hydroxyacyl-CoA dehydratase family protein [Spirochaetota bacterium]